jgi:hypothetical protein
MFKKFIRDWRLAGAVELVLYLGEGVPMKLKRGHVAWTAAAALVCTAGWALATDDFENQNFFDLLSASPDATYTMSTNGGSTATHVLDWSGAKGSEEAYSKMIDGGTIDIDNTDLTDGLEGALEFDADWGGYALYLNTTAEADGEKGVLELQGGKAFKNPVYAAGHACLRGAGATCASSSTENACFNGSGTDFCASLERVRVMGAQAGCNATNGYNLVYTMFAGSRNPSEQNSGESGIEPGCDCDDSTSADGCAWISGK